MLRTKYSYHIVIIFICNLRCDVLEKAAEIALQVFNHFISVYLLQLEATLCSLKETNVLVQYYQKEQQMGSGRAYLFLVSSI